MDKKNRINIPGYIVLLFLGLFCIVILFYSFATGFSGGFLTVAADYVFAPMQEGLSNAGSGISHAVDTHREKEKLLAENESLTRRVNELESKLTNTQLKQNELERLEGLLQLSKDYDQYKTTGARIIAKGTSNWFTTFTIDKGSSDGIKKDMNVIADGGLVGRITAIGPNWARVTSIIADNANVSGMVLSTADRLIGSGSLELMSRGEISFSQLIDSDDQVAIGDKIVTSNISDKYLPGILIGYITEINTDSNNLSKSGYLTPAVDFEHLDEVLVILEVKQTVQE